MEKKKCTWIIGICIAVVVILAVVAASTGGCARNDQKKGNGQVAAQSGSSGSQPSSGAAASESSKADTDSHSGHNNGSGSDTKSSQINDMLNGNDSLGKYLTEQDSIMMGMMDEMVIREHSGNASLDFLKGMIPHHEAAIDMAESYLKYGGESTELENIAKDIISVQKDELKQMNELMKQYEEDGKTDPKKEEEYLEKYSSMFSEGPMSHHLDPSSVDTIDQAFGEGMILHHQMAVDMAKDILEYTDYEEIRKLAQDIIDTQEKEIEDMKKASHTS